jgi:hypothetical protein
MNLEDIVEISPLTIKGSFSEDLIASKNWLAEELKNILQKNDLDSFGTIYVLGSWYGNMGVVLLHNHVPFNKLINVDTNKEWLTKSEEILQHAGIGDRLESMNKNANEINYRQLDADGLVINTSTQDINGKDWFRNIPKGVYVAIQDRNATRSSQHSNVEEFSQAYPLSKTMFLGKKRLSDETKDYVRFMKIGIK